MGEPTEVRTITAAAGGTPLAPPASRTDYIPIAAAGKLAGVGTLSVTMRNFAGGAIAVQLFLNPRVTILVVNDSFVASPTEESDAAQDGDAATDVTLSALAALPAGAIWVGVKRPIRGLVADVDGANAVAATLAALYWNGSAMTAVASLSDGTANGGATFAVDGEITFTVTADCTVARLLDILSLDPKTSSPASDPILHDEMLWLRLSVSDVLTNPTTLNSLMAINRSTDESEWLEGQVVTFDGVMTGRDGLGCIEAHVDQGTANIIANINAVFES